MNRNRVGFFKSYVPAVFGGKKDALRPSPLSLRRDVTFLCKTSIYVPTSLNVLFTSLERELRPYVPLLYIGGDRRDVTFAARTAPITERQARTAAETLAAAPKEVGPGQGTRTDMEPRVNGTKLTRGSNNKTYLAARLNRDHPEIAERVKAGDPQNRSTLIWLAMGWLMPPTRYRATSRNGDGTGSGLVIRETERNKVISTKPSMGPDCLLRVWAGSAVAGACSPAPTKTSHHTFMSQKPHTDQHTQRERLTLETIRLKAAKFEHGLLKAAVRAGKLPTSKTLIARMIAVTFKRSFQ